MTVKLPTVTERINHELSFCSVFNSTPGFHPEGRMVCIAGDMRAPLHFNQKTNMILSYYFNQKYDTIILLCAELFGSWKFEFVGEYLQSMVCTIKEQIDILSVHWAPFLQWNKRLVPSGIFNVKTQILRRLLQFFIGFSYHSEWSYIPVSALLMILLYLFSAVLISSKPYQPLSHSSHSFHFIIIIDFFARRRKKARCKIHTRPPLDVHLVQTLDVCHKCSSAERLLLNRPTFSIQYSSDATIDSTQVRGCAILILAPMARTLATVWQFYRP